MRVTQQLHGAAVIIALRKRRVGPAGQALAFNRMGTATHHRDRLGPAAVTVRRWAALAIIAALVLTSLAGHTQPTAPAGVPMLSGMGSYRLPSASSDVQAQRYFRQGTSLTYGFNPGEGARAFEAATVRDPACALCWWGLAWALGPTINADMASESPARIALALDRARVAARSGPLRTRALIAALSARHPAGSRIDEEAYAQAMQKLARSSPHDADLLVLTAEALMNLHPYDWWQPDGRPRPWTPAIERLLRAAMRIAPDHPGAHHYWIHLEEGSPHPEQALRSAEILPALVPGSGHLLHMPAHVYMRVGRYAAASAASERSIAADARYESEVAASQAYRVGYVAHNHHFLWASAAMEGRSAVALAAARAAYPAACGAGKPQGAAGLVQSYAVLPLFALVRFGRWQEILTATLPPDVAEPFPLAIWHYARGTALAKTGRPDRALEELARLREIGQAPALSGVRIKNLNPLSALVQIASSTLQSDIALAQGRAADAVPLLREATAIEDGLAADEPHEWLAPTRQALGAALLAAGRAAEAERAYREDLARYPENGWSLFGLALAVRRQGREAEARAIDARFAHAWAAADIMLPGSRF